MLERWTAGLRPREPRTAVMVPCRVKRGSGWADACIHNVSSRGLLIALENAPARGTYVDIRRGSLVIVGRVMWQRDSFIGVRTQDRISAATLTAEPRSGKAPPAGTERRSGARLDVEGKLARRVERRRHLSRALQFGVLLCAGMGAALFAASSVRQVLERPFAVASRAMGQV